MREFFGWFVATLLGVALILSVTHNRLIQERFATLYAASDSLRKTDKALILDYQDELRVIHLTVDSLSRQIDSTTVAYTRREQEWRRRVAAGIPVTAVSTQDTIAELQAQVAECGCLLDDLHHVNALLVAKSDSLTRADSLNRGRIRADSLYIGSLEVIVDSTRKLRPPGEPWSLSVVAGAGVDARGRAVLAVVGGLRIFRITLGRH